MLNTAPYDWVVSHLGAIVAWALFLSAFAFAFYRFLVLCYRATRTFVTVEQRVLKAEETIYTMANNHLVHIQSAVEDSNKHLAEISHTLTLALVKRGEDA